MLKKIIKSALLSRLNHLSAEIRKESETSLLLQARQLINTFNYDKTYTSLADVEFSVFSQWGDDGIIQYLIRKVNIDSKLFVEFGVENYTEANTRFLLMHNNWSGLVMDGSEDNVSFIKKDNVSWRYDLKSKCAFVTAENINSLLLEEGLSGNIGLLHIDIDGNDYWVWKNLTAVDADIVIVEYNSSFGPSESYVIPYQKEFIRTKAHYSNLYFGASLSAFCDLGNSLGYAFVGCNSAGNNAYFVKRHKLGTLRELTPEEGFVEAKFRESRNQQGELTFLTGARKRNELKGLPVINLKSGQTETL